MISIHDGHTSSVALMIDGEVMYAIQEERITREKNAGGFPLNALNNLLEYNKLTIEDIDKFIFVGYTSAFNLKSRKDVLNKYSRFYNNVEGVNKRSYAIKSFLKNYIPKEKIQNHYYKKHMHGRISPLIKMGVPENKIDFVEHHTCHAASAAYGWGINDDFVIITSDSSGDGISGTVNIFKDGELKRLAYIDIDDSIARIYSLITYYMGMVPMEHEYKLMGMAPYAENSRQAREIADYFHSLFEFDSELTFKRKKGIEPVYLMGPRLEKFLRFRRFDHICAGLQLFVEEFITKWIKRILNHLKMGKIALSGGLFMNVKLNKRIMELDEVEDIFIFPSCGDESNVFGALYHIYYKKYGKKPKPLTHYYMGPEYSDDEIKEAIDSYQFNSKVSVENYENIESEIAKLLAKGKIVARFKGRMEFGARALCNRSILANPSIPDVVKTINRMIKSRDFWMPFAPSMINSERYIINPKKIKAPYMILTFDTKKEKIKIMNAAVHPYDETCRPQEIYEDWNPDCFRLIKEYERITGESVILNTSFNLHGYPIVCAPKDALYVFDNSGLEYLAIGNYLLAKVANGDNYD